MHHSSSLFIFTIFAIFITLASSNSTTDSLSTFEKELRQHDKAIQRAICVKHSVSVLVDAVDRLTCVERFLPIGTVRRYQLIFVQVTGLQNYPEILTDWKHYICTQRYFLTVKDIVDLSFLISITQDDHYYNAEAMLRRRFSRCPHVTESFYDVIKVISSNKHHFVSKFFSGIAKIFNGQGSPKGINGTEDSFLPNTDRCDRTGATKSDPYCIKKESYQKNITTACQNVTSSNQELITTDFGRDIIKQQKCLERSSTHRSFWILKACWEDIVSTNYPNTDKEFLQFFCGHTYPNALGRMVNSCYFERMRGTFVSWSLESKNWTVVEDVESNYHCAPTIFRESEKTILLDYRKRYIPIQVRWQRNQACLSRSEDMIKGVFLDATCPLRSSTSRGKLFLKFCWKSAANTDMPRTTFEWLSLLCRESLASLQTIQQQVSQCFSLAPKFLYAANLTDTMMRDFTKRYEGCSTSLPLVEPEEQNSTAVKNSK